MKRYLLFAYDHYYPEGGWQDFKDSFGTVEAARQAVRGNEIIDTVFSEQGYISKYDVYELIDSETGQEIDLD